MLEAGNSCCFLRGQVPLFLGVFDEIEQLEGGARRRRIPDKLVLLVPRGEGEIPDGERESVILPGRVSRSRFTDDDSSPKNLAVPNGGDQARSVEPVRRGDTQKGQDRG